MAHRLGSMVAKILRQGVVMCGILMVKSRNKIELSQHLAALDTLRARGPDFEIYCHNNNVFVAQTVLHITGSDDFYHTPRDDFFAFNGEIYNYRDFGAATSDTEVAYDAAKNNVLRFREFTGPWAWVLYRDNTLTYATDPQGERVLYQYQDQDLLIVASEVTAILQYVNCDSQSVPYRNKGWTLLQHTPWQGIKRLTPGMLYCQGEALSEIDSVWNWIKPTHITQEQAQEEFQQVWSNAYKYMIPKCESALSYSAGIDSNLILDAMPNIDLIAIDCVGKDPVVSRYKEFLNSAQLSRLQKINVDPETWAQHYRDLITHTRMPAQSWSFVGKWIVAKHCKQRVLFTGLAADELFGGYGIYHNIEYSQQRSHSPYSRDDHDNLWQRCVDSYQGDCRQATLLMDYFYQVVAVDAVGQDRIAGAWGIETRNPFMYKDVMHFALNLPWNLKVGQETKPLLKTKFRQTWHSDLVLPKMGFAGHANDSVDWLGVKIETTGDRHQDWVTIAQSSYQQLCHLRV